jgi:hypothetical protein
VFTATVVLTLALGIGATTAVFTLIQLSAFQIGTGNGELAVRRAGSAAAVQARLGEYVSVNFFRTFGIGRVRPRHEPKDARSAAARRTAPVAGEPSRDRLEDRVLRRD